MMFAPFEALLWIAEHWWLLAAIAVVALGAVLWTGVVQLGAVVVASTRILAGIVKFFATETAEKILFGFCVAVLALSIGFQHGRYVTNATWARREAARAAAMETLRAETARAAEEMIKAGQDAEDRQAAAAQQRINDYARTLPKVSDACRITAADLVAAGVPDDRRRPQGRDPGRLQHGAQPRAARQGR